MNSEHVFLTWLVWNIIFSFYFMKLYDVLKEILDELRKDGDGNG